MPTKVFSGDQGFTQYISTDDDHIYDVFDATDATFNMEAGNSNRDYPVTIRAAPGAVTWSGGTFLGDMAEATHRNAIYPATNSALLFFRWDQGPARDVTISDTVMGVEGDLDTGFIDGFRLRGNGVTYTLNNTRMHLCRDDGFESDDCNAEIIINNSLWENQYSIISVTGDWSGTKNITCNNFLASMYPWADANATDFGHAHPIKVGQGNGVYQFTMNNCVIAITSRDYNGFDRMNAFFNNVQGSGNEYLLMGDTFEAGDPLPGAGWTIYEGSAATARWAERKNAFLATIPEAAGDTLRFSLTVAS